MSNTLNPLLILYHHQLLPHVSAPLCSKSLKEKSTLAASYSSHSLQEVFHQSGCLHYSINTALTTVTNGLPVKANG